MLGCNLRKITLQSIFVWVQLILLVWTDVKKHTCFPLEALKKSLPHKVLCSLVWAHTNGLIQLPESTWIHKDVRRILLPLGSPITNIPGTITTLCPALALSLDLCCTVMPEVGPKLLSAWWLDSCPLGPRRAQPEVEIRACRLPTNCVALSCCWSGSEFRKATL